MNHLALIAVAVLPSAALATTSLSGLNLLTGARVRATNGVQSEDRMRDRAAAQEGDFWNTPLTSIIAPNGSVEWDLGAQRPIAAAMIQADNNDDYLVHGSEDGQSWALIWRAGAHPEPGLRMRQQRFSPPLTARYLRLTAEGGDQLFSVSELQLFSDPSADLLSDVTFKPLTVQPQQEVHGCGGNTLVLVFAVGGAILLFLLRLRSRGTATEPDSPGKAP